MLSAQSHCSEWIQLPERLHPFPRLILLPASFLFSLLSLSSLVLCRTGPAHRISLLFSLPVGALFSCVCCGFFPAAVALQRLFPAPSKSYHSYSSPRRSWRSHPPSSASASSPRPPRSWPPATSGRIPSLSLIVLLVILKSGRILLWVVFVSTEQGMRAFETPMKSTRDQPSEGRQLAHPHHCRLCAKLHTHP